MVDVKLAVPLFVLILPGRASAQDREFTLSAPDEIVRSGLLLSLLAFRSKINDPCVWTNSHLLYVGAAFRPLRRDCSLNGTGH
jgi:hypothetical protein